MSEPRIIETIVDSVDAEQEGLDEVARRNDAAARHGRAERFLLAETRAWPEPVVTANRWLIVRRAPVGQ